ncbi:hypothetical protein C1H46_045669 [Malus baccata]|uniref:Squalene monooxygenase n=1 Tax=Malus baccata TaxID=106549 RepID=A0A540K3J4_MALBA|nr:hypothetical protein C1H46_045669 [Malus baccata]
MIINTTLSGEKKKVVEKVSDGVKGNGYVRMPSQNGNCLPEIASGMDVVIVGAGVAGAALTYTLGKVTK